MRVNADFSAPAFARTGEMEWIPSPTPGVQRRMLDRVGDEVARATSLVRYAPRSRFPEHTHGGGEEFLVLQGVFADEHGEYPAGTYVRNPPGSSHAPASPAGCVLLVKLRQFADDDTDRVVVDTRAGAWQPTGVDGVERLLLHGHGRERVALYRLARGSRVPEHEHPGGEETFVLEGGLADGEREYLAGDWLRLPPGSRHAVTSEAGAVLWVKTGHLPPTEPAV
ncbi:MAG TPA: cupin domain-containing protein [Woeseiaceae bacterium]|nr:cupin domain-containing protein [Woeseiaceae bacterium]